MDVSGIIRDVVGANKPLPKRSVLSRDWQSWYRGKVKGFHNYRIYNGTRYLELERKSLQMAKQVCETWANLLMNERCDIILPDKEKKVLDEIYHNTNFWLKINDGVEKAFALGLGALVMNVKDIEVGVNTGILKTDNSYISIDFVNETKMHPITIQDKEITECAFVSKNSDSTSIVVHVLQEGTYKIHNYLLDSQDQVTKNYVFDTKSKKPWFWVLRPNISSNVITELNDDEIGISVFANSIDVLKAIDNKYDGFDWEFVLGRKRMYVSAEAWTVNKQDGETIKTFDPYDTLFYQLPENDEGKPIITESSGDLRYDAYIKGIQQELDFLSMKCGLGETYYKFDGSNVATATQVISENSTLYRNIKKHELILEKILRELTKAVIQASNEFTKIKFGELKDDQIIIQFDDSIIEDKTAEMARDRLDVSSGIMAIHEYRMKWYGEDEKTAIEKVRENFLYVMIDNYTQALTSGAMTPEQFVNKVYPDDKNKPELIAYIEEFVNSSPEINMNPLYSGIEGDPDKEDEAEDKKDIEDEDEEDE